MRKEPMTIILILYTLIMASFVSLNYAKFEWTKTTHDFGEIKYNQPVSYEFEFTNQGQSFLIISKIEASCGCTASEFTKDPVAPGGKGKVKASFDAAALGNFHKSLMVVSNVEGGPEYLYIKGTVVE